MDKKFDYISEAKKVFDIEIEALEKTRDALGEDFETILNLILDVVWQITEKVNACSSL